VELLPLLLIFAVMILPLMWMSSRQRKAQQKQQELVRALGVGDEVRTHSGFYGLIIEEFDDVVILESENGAQTKWARQAIAMKVEDPSLESIAEDGDAAAEEQTADPASEESAQSSDGTVPGVTVDDDRRDR